MINVYSQKFYVNREMVEFAFKMCRRLPSEIMFSFKGVRLYYIFGEEQMACFLQLTPIDSNRNKEKEKCHISFSACTV